MSKKLILLEISHATRSRASPLSRQAPNELGLDVRGATSVEYAILAAAVLGVGLAAWSSFGRVVCGALDDTGLAVLRETALRRADGPTGDSARSRSVAASATEVLASWSYYGSTNSDSRGRTKPGEDDGADTKKEMSDGESDITIIDGTEDSGAGWVEVPSKMRTAAFVARHPLAAHDIGKPDPGKGKKNISNNSVRFSTNDLGLEETENHEGSQVNAFRHALWQATIAQHHGVDIALEIGFAHEDNPRALNGIEDPSQIRFTKSALADESVDLLNNQIGRAIGEELEGEGMDDIALEVLKHYHHEGFWVSKQEADGTYSIHQEKLSNEQFETARDKLKTLDGNGFTPEQAKEWD